VYAEFYYLNSCQAKKKVLQEHQERIKLEAEMEGVRKSSKSEQELKQQVCAITKAG
jgi:hypothetical protein